VSETDPLTLFKGTTTPEGHTYWVDPETSASVWERPEAYGWVEEPSKEHEGVSFFYNQVRAWRGRAASRWDTVLSPGGSAPLPRCFLSPLTPLSLFRR
jgi:hypothetical protein